jgi:type I restriction enzyme S subunit
MLTDICDPSDDWDVKSLRDLVEAGKVELGRGNVISKKEMRAKPGNYPVYSSSVTGDGKIGEYGEYMFDEEMITWSVDGGGHLFYRPKHKFSVTNIGGYIRLHTDDIDYRWLHALLALQHRHITFDYQLKAHPSVIKDIYQVFDVPIEEQRRIADVLDTVDAAIQETDAVVEKQEQVKTGLLQDLLTRGLDADGCLRDPEREPEAFRETELGRVPAKWDLVPLSEVSAHITKGATPTTYGFDWVDQGTPFLRSEAVKDGRFEPVGIRYIPEAAHEKMARSAVQGGDLLMTITGNLGRVCRYPEDLPEANINQHIARIRVVSSDRVLPEFTLWA